MRASTGQTMALVAVEAQDTGLIEAVPSTSMAFIGQRSLQAPRSVPATLRMGYWARSSL